MKILLIFSFVNTFRFIDSESLVENSYFERKNDKVLTFNIAQFPNFEISAPL